MKKRNLVVVFVAILAFTALPVASQTAQAFFDQAIAQYKAKNYKESERLFGECLRVDPKDVECLYRRGLVRELYIGYGLALEDYTAALALSPNSHVLLTQRGQLYSSLKRPDDGIADLTKAIQIKSDHARAYYTRANIYRDKNEVDKAIADYGSALTYDPKDDLSLWFRASLYEKKGERDKAIADFTRAIALKPDKGNYYFYRGRNYWDQKQTALAEADFARAIQLDPTLESRVKSIKTLADIAKLSAAIQANQPKPKTPAEAARFAGTDHYLKKEWDQAIVQYTKAIELEPLNHWNWVYRARSYEGKGMFDQALVDLNNGIALLTPAEASAFMTERAGLYFKQGKKTIALAAINKIIESKPKTSEYDLLLRGKIHASMGNKTAARADLEKAVQLNQYLKEAKDELAKL